eukprot:jgi/Bigna1/135277/aug1.28_g9985
MHGYFQSQNQRKRSKNNCQDIHNRVPPWTSPVAMRRHRNYVRRTKKGSVLKVVAEHYLRTDIWCGSALCTECNSDTAILDGSELGVPEYFILDTNVCLHQIDVIEDETFGKNIILTQTVLEETRHRSINVYNRLYEIINNQRQRKFYVFSNEHHMSTYVERDRKESPNDRNDRAIRVAARWYDTHLEKAAKITLITDDRDNREKAEKDGLSSMSTKDYILNRIPVGEPQDRLLDLLASPGDGVEAGNQSGGGVGLDGRGGLQIGAGTRKKRSGEWLYKEHIPLSKAKQEIALGKLYQGVFKVNRNYWKEASVRAQGGKLAKPVLICGLEDMNRAIDGDVVAIALNGRDKWDKARQVLLPTGGLGAEEIDETEAARVVGDGGQQTTQSKHKEMEVDDDDEKQQTTVVQATGRVVAILRRNTRAYCGSIELNDRSKGMTQGKINFISVDRRIPKIQIFSRQIQSILDKRIVVQFDGWPRNSRRPHGHYVRTLGKIGDLDTETNVVLLEHDIPTQAWSPAVLKCLPPEDWCITNQEAEKRRDLRNEPEIWVHIADVTHYVREGSALDLEALNRATSVYLVQRRIDMIPSMLSTDLCSLKEKVDRLAFSVIWEINPTNEIVRTWFGKTVIHSKQALAYGDAQKILDDDTAKGPVAFALKNLNRIAKVLRVARRRENGALTLASPQIRFVLDSESQKPQDAEMYQLKEANGMVEEFMLLANISVAKRILRSFPSFAILRRHPKPSETQFDMLVRAAAVKGLKIDARSNKALGESLDRCVIKGFPYFNTLIRVLATRCMTQAVYFSSGSVEEQE